MSHPVRDAHTHFFSRIFFDTLARSAPGGRGVPDRVAEITEKAGITSPPDDPFELQLKWLEAMDRAGVESMVTFASVPEEAEVVSEVCKGSGGRLAGYVAMSPVAGSAAALAERAMSELGLRGVVLFPALHHYDMGDPALAPVLSTLARARAVCVVHCGILEVKLRDLFGLPRSYDARFANPLSIVRAASAHPEVAFVIPHFGGGLLRETLLTGQWCPNVYVDTSSSNGWMTTQVPRLQLRDVFAHALDVFGPGRILFGTDSSVFPRGYRADILRAQETVLDQLGISDGDRAAILGGNLERLLAATKS